MTTDKPIFIPFLDNGNGAVVDSFMRRRRFRFGSQGRCRSGRSRGGAEGSVRESCSLTCELI